MKLQVISPVGSMPSQDYLAGQVSSHTEKLNVNRVDVIRPTKRLSVASQIKKLNKAMQEIAIIAYLIQDNVFENIIKASYF
jgi:hypothetical protein